MAGRTNLADIIGDYVQERKALGYRSDKAERVLRGVSRMYREMGLLGPVLDKELVIKWTEKRAYESECNRAHRISVIRGLAEYMIRQGYAAYLYPRRSGPLWQSNYQPHVFSDAEIASLLRRADSCELNAASPHRHLFLPLLVRILYGSGLRVSEALSLRKEDVDLNEGVLFVKGAKFGKERLVPLSRTVHDRCREYVAAMERHRVWKDTAYFFPAPHGGKYSVRTAYQHFRKLLWEAGISHGGRGKGPRLHDLRHTYAVHCLRKWVKEGVDLTATMPYLSAYLGHSGIRGTQRYLRLTAELYPDIVKRTDEHFSWVIPEVNA
ncbi:MAG: tyrosine-type recombinase/integrase [Synergistales bacterium]|nr:tyrosine-type recombinase/integrase [Synergistales bacterium]